MDLVAAVAFGVAVGAGIGFVIHIRRESRSEQQQWEAFQAAMRRHP